MDTQHSAIRDIPRRRRLLGIMFMVLPLLALLCRMGWLAAARFYPSQPTFAVLFLNILSDALRTVQNYAAKPDMWLLLPLFLSGAWLVWRPLQLRSFLFCCLSAVCFTGFIWLTFQPFAILGICFLAASLFELYTLLNPGGASFDVDVTTVRQYPQCLGWALVFAPFILAFVETVIFSMRPLQISVAGDPEPRISAVWAFMKLLGVYLPLLFPVCYCGWRLLLARQVSGKLWMALTFSFLFLGLALFLLILTHAL